MSQIKELQPREGVTLLAVKVPEGAYDFKIQNSKLYYGGYIFTYKSPERWNTYKKENWVWPTLTMHKLVILGIATEIPEEVWQGIFEPVAISRSGRQKMYIDYVKGGFSHFHTATESAMSLLASHEVYSVNPYGPVRPEYNTIDREKWAKDHHQWRQAEANTGTWVILMKQND